MTSRRSRGPSVRPELYARSPRVYAQGVSEPDQNEPEEQDPGEAASKFADQVKHLADILDLDEDSLEDEPIELNDDELDLVLEENEETDAVLHIEYDGASYEVGAERFIIGRASCDLKIVDANVSRHHCAIDRVDGAYVIRDLGSTNGVEIAGTKVQEHRLADGDVIKISGHELLASFSATVELLEVPSVVEPVAVTPTSVITQRMDVPAPATETVIASESMVIPESGDAAFQERMEVRLDAMARELSDLRAAVERISDMLENLTVEAMGRLLQGRVEQARRNRRP